MTKLVPLNTAAAPEAPTTAPQEVAGMTQAEPQKQKGVLTWALGILKDKAVSRASEAMGGKDILAPSSIATEVEADIKGVKEAVSSGSLRAGLEERKRVKTGEEPSAIAPILERGETAFKRELQFGFGKEPEKVGGFAGEVSEAIGMGGGFVASLLATGGALELLKGYRGIQAMLTKTPRLARYARPLFDNVTRLVARNQLSAPQLDADVKERISQAWSDIKLGTFFSIISPSVQKLSGLAGAKLPESLRGPASMLIEYPTEFAIGYALTDGTKEEKLANGIANAAMHGAMKIQGPRLEELSPADRARAENAIKEAKATWDSSMKTRQATLRDIDAAKPDYRITTSANANTYAREAARAMDVEPVKFQIEDVPEPTLSSDGKSVFLPRSMSSDDMKGVIVDAHMQSRLPVASPEVPVPSQDGDGVWKDAADNLLTLGRVQVPEPQPYGPHIIGTPTGRVAKDMQEQYGIPLYESVVLPIEEAHPQIANLQRAAKNVVDEMLGPFASNPELRGRMGSYLVETQLQKVKRASPEAQAIADGYGLSPEQKAAADKLADTLPMGFRQVAEAAGVKFTPRDEYWSLIRRQLPPTEQVVQVESPRERLKAFFQHQRGSGDTVKDYHTDPYVIANIYATQLGRGAFMQSALDNYAFLRRNSKLPKDVRERMDDFIDANTGRFQTNERVDRFIDNAADFVDKGLASMGITSDIRTTGRMMRDILGLSFFNNTLGLPNLHILMLQRLQPYQLGVAEFGPVNFAKHIGGAEKESMLPKNWKKGLDKGWHQVDPGTRWPIVRAELAEAKGGGMKVGILARELLNLGLSPMRVFDAEARIRTGLIAEKVWDANADLLKKGDIDGFFEATNISSMEPTEQAAIRKAIEEGDLQTAKDRHSMMRVQGVNFPTAPGQFGARRSGILTGPVRTFTSFPLQTVDAFFNRYNATQRASFILTAVAMMEAFEKAGLEEGRQLGPTAALQGVANVGQTFFDTASAAVGGLRAALSAMNIGNLNAQEQRDLVKEMITQGKNFLPGTKWVENIKRLQKSLQNPGELYSRTQNLITPLGRPTLDPWLQFFSFTPEAVQDAYDIYGLSDEQVAERRAKTDHLKSLVNSGKMEEAQQYWLENPDIQNYDLEGSQKSLLEKAFDNVPKERRGIFLEGVQKILGR